MKLKFTAILLLFSLCISAQKITLKGTITDSNTGETLIGVNIIVKGSSTGTMTNEYGFYSIDLKNNQKTLIFSYLGYLTLEKTIDTTKNQTLNIALHEDSNTLDEIVISAEGGKAIKKLRTAQMSVSKLSAKKIKSIPTVLGESDILQAITILPGVTNAGEGSAGFNVRGGAADQNLVLLDEATIYNTSHLFGFFSVFNVDAIKNINLYKGGIPSQFGGRISSVLDVKQKDGNNQEFHVNGGVGIIYSRLMVEGPIESDNSSFLIAGRMSTVDLLLAASKNKNRVGFYDLNTKFSFNLNDNNRLFLSVYHGNDKIKIGENIFENNYGNSSFNLRWNHIFNSKLFSNLSLIYSQYRYDLSLDSNNLDWISNIKNYNIKYDFNYNLTNNLKVNFGTQTQFYQFKPGEITIKNENNTLKEFLDKKTAIEPAIYIGVNQKIGDKLNLNYGIRASGFLQKNEKLYEYVNNQSLVFNQATGTYERGIRTGESSKKSTSYIGFEPRISLSYLLNETSSVKASYQKTYQYLHQISNTNAPSPLDLWMPSGNFIKPQSSHQFAVGYFKNFYEEKYSLEIESYYKTVKNRLDYIDGADLIANNHLETELLSGKSRAYGLELLVKKNKGIVTGSLSYTLSKSEQLVTGRTPFETGINDGKWYNTPYDRTHDFSLNASYKLNDQWSFNSNFIFQTGRPTNFPSGQYSFDDVTVPIFLNRNKSRLPNYHRLDLSISYKPSKNQERNWQEEWNLGLYNVYARRNANAITFRKNILTGENEAIRTSIFGTIIPSITYNFKF